MPAASDPERDPTAGAVEAAATPGPDTPDLGRRMFFRRFAGELVQTAASLTGAAAVAQGAVAGAAAVTQELATAATPAATPLTSRPAAAPSMEQLARTHLAGRGAPWSWDGDRLLLIDQRRLPAAVVAFPVGSAVEAARAIGDRVTTGPSAAVIAVWGLALSAEAAAHHPAGTRAALRAGAERSVLAADPGSHVLRRAVTALGAALDAGEPARAAAERLEAAIVADHERLVARLALELPRSGVAAPLVHGPVGTLWGVGVSPILEASLDVRRSVTAPVTVTEGRPWLDGARVTAWELAQRGAPARVLLDAAGPGAVARAEVDGVLCAAERTAVDGAVSVAPGGLGLAMAAAHAGVPFVVVAAGWAIDPTAPDAAALGEPPLGAVATARSWGSAVVPVGATVDAARVEVVPAELISRLVTPT
jgi:methylthioribose-1-phosphate isomerase